MNLNKNEQLKLQSEEPQQNENKGTQQKIPQLKIHTGLRVGYCVWDYDCQKYWCYD